MAFKGKIRYKFGLAENEKFKWTSYGEHEKSNMSFGI